VAARYAVVESVKPGSGQGIAKCFAYVKRTKDSGPVQIGKRWAQSR